MLELLLVSGLDSFFLKFQQAIEELDCDDTGSLNSDYDRIPGIRRIAAADDIDCFDPCSLVLGQKPRWEIMCETGA